MKNLIYFILIFTLFSCEKENTFESEGLDNQLNRTSNRCLLINQTPFSNQSVTFSFECSSYPLNDCFDTEMETFLLDEVEDQFLISQQGLHIPVFISSNQAYLELDQVINTNNIYPFISASDANTVYQDIACKIIGKILMNGNPGFDRYYGIDITYLATDFNLCCGGPEDAFITVNYDIWKY